MSDNKLKVREQAEDLTAARNLLAVIHRDGGHHTEAVGFVQSCKDAEQARHAMIVALAAERERAEKVEAELASARKSYEQAEDDRLAVEAELAAERERVERLEKALCEIAVGKTLADKRPVLGFSRVVGIAREALRPAAPVSVATVFGGAADRLDDLAAALEPTPSEQETECFRRLKRRTSEEPKP